MISARSDFLGPRITTLGFFVLVGAFGLNFASGQFFVPAGEEQGIGLAAFSAVAALNTAVAGLVQPFLGRVIDRVGARAVIAAGVALLGLSWLALAAATELWHFVVLYGLLAAAAFGSSSSMSVSVLVSHWYERRRARVLARTFMGINAGQLMLAPLAGLLIATAGWRTAYLALGLVVAGLLAPAAWLGLRSRPADVGQTPDGDAPRPAGNGGAARLRDALRHREWWLLTAGFAINGATLYLVLLHLPRLAVDLGGGLATGGALIAVAAAGSAASMLAQSRLAELIDKRRLIVALFTLRALAFLLAAALTGPAGLWAFAVLFGVSSFPVVPLITGAIADRLGTRVIGAALGVTFVAHQLGAGLGVLGTGLARDATNSYDSALLAGAAALALACALVSRVRPVDLYPKGHP